MIVSPFIWVNEIDAGLLSDEDDVNYTPYAIWAIWLWIILCAQLKTAIAREAYKGEQPCSM